MKHGRTSDIKQRLTVITVIRKFSTTLQYMFHNFFTTFVDCDYLP